MATIKAVPAVVLTCTGCGAQRISGLPSREWRAQHHACPQPAEVPHPKPRLIVPMPRG